MFHSGVIALCAFLSFTMWYFLSVNIYRIMGGRYWRNEAMRRLEALRRDGYTAPKGELHYFDVRLKWLNDFWAYEYVGGAFPWYGAWIAVSQCIAAFLVGIYILTTSLTVLLVVIVGITSWAGYQVGASSRRKQDNETFRDLPVPTSANE